MKTIFAVLGRPAPLLGCLSEDEAVPSPTLGGDPTPHTSHISPEPENWGSQGVNDSPVREQERTQKPRSFVDVLECLM